MTVIPPPEFLTSVTPPVFQRATYGKTYDYDFVAGVFITTGVGVDPVVVLDTTASLAQAIEKIWRTPRYADLAYDGNYGCDLVPLATAGNVSAELLLNDLEGAATDGVMSDPRSQLFTDIDLTLDDPNNPTSVQIEGNVLDIYGVTTALNVTIAV